jgi:hypothetical protein
MKFFLPGVLRRTTAFDLPIRVQVNRRTSIKYKFRGYIKKIVKHLAIHLDLYKPEKTLGELLEEIKIFLRIASEKFEKVYFIQHHHLEDGRLQFESQVYQEYYLGILDFVRTQRDVNIEVIELPGDFLDQRNYLPDSLHLSLQGHVELCHLIVRSLES